MYRSLFVWMIVASCVAFRSFAFAADEPKSVATKKAEPKTKAAKRAEAKSAEATLVFPPTLPGGKTVVTDTSPKFLEPPATLKPGVQIAKTAPTVDLLYYPGQDYLGNPWSNWGDSLAANGKYYSAIGDHFAANGKDLSHGAGTAHVFEYDPLVKSFRLLTDTTKLLALPAGHYAPGKIHSRIDIGGDGKLYFATHRGSTKVTTDEFHYQGDWILSADPTTGHSEVVAHGAVPKHCIPNSVLDPERMIFYGGTAAGTGGETDAIHFFAYDVKNKKILYDGPDGPARAMIFAKSIGRVYYVPGAGEGQLMCFDPATGKPPQPVAGVSMNIRAATQESPAGIVYTATHAKDGDAQLYAFDVKTETATPLGSLAVGTQAYVATLDADPTGRYLYYIPGAHGGSDRDGSAVVQFDTKTKAKKVLAFLHPFYQEAYGVTLKGTYGAALDPSGDKLYITWNANRGSKAWDCCALTVVHLPKSER